MVPHLMNEFPAHLLMWQRVREYAVPPSMIETATARRARGDWAGACAAARIDVDLDLRAVRHRHGADLATRLRTDLRLLAPDLLRWHLPRIAPDGRLRPGLTISLARYGSGDTVAPLHLVVRTPPTWADAGQRVSLALWEGPGSGAPGHHPHPHPDRRFRLDLHRHLWDAGRSGELAGRCGADGPPVAAPPGHPHAAGPPHASDQPVPPDRSRPLERADPRAVHESWWTARWAAEAELLLRAEGRSRGGFTVRLGRRDHAVFELVAPDDSHAPTVRPLREALGPQDVAALPALPEAAIRIPPDLELLRAGLVTVERLHPLVAAALGGVGSTAEAARMHWPGDPHRVECRGEVHRIALRNGVLTAIDHDLAQLRREELLVALGGPALPCLRAIDAVHHSPEALPAIRERLTHGDFAGALTVVEGLLGPKAVLRDGPLRDELESAAAGCIDHGVFRAGLIAVHPAAGAAGGGNDLGERHAEWGHRPRLDRRTPLALRRKRSSRPRPRTGLAS
jgi:hypothetical protein